MTPRIPAEQLIGLHRRRVYSRNAPSDVVFCDVDGVLADFSSAFSALVSSKFPELSLTHTSEVRDWYWKEHGWTAEHFAWGWRQVRKAENWWEQVKPLASPEVFARIAALHTTVPIIFATARTISGGDSTQMQTIRWLEAQGIERPLVITRTSRAANGHSDKSDLAEIFQPRLVIDDAPDTVRKFARKGVTVLVPPWPYTEGLDKEFPNNVYRMPVLDALRFVG